MNWGPHYNDRARHSPHHSFPGGSQYFIGLGHRTPERRARSRNHRHCPFPPSCRTRYDTRIIIVQHTPKLLLLLVLLFLLSAANMATRG